MKSALSELYKNYRDRDYVRDGLTAAEGRLLAQRLLESDLEPLGVAVTEAWAEHFTSLAAGRCPVEVLGAEQLSAFAGFPFHRGVIAWARRPVPLNLQTFLEQGHLRGRLAAVPRLTDPENLGAVIRSASALGWDGILVGPETCDPFSRRCAKVSMGTVYSRKPVHLPSPGETALLFSSYGWTSAACVLENDAQSLEDFIPPEKLVLWLGNEHDGLDEPWRRLCTRALTLPMAAGVDSLNVAVAAGIFLYETRLRRSPKPPQ